jgi:multiple sugar transport system substrate-binding protein
VRRIRLIPTAVLMVSAALAVAVAASIGGATTAAAGTRADAGSVVFMSTQLNSIVEAEAFRNTLLKGFQGNVQKIDLPLGNTTLFFDRIKAESETGKGTVSLLGGLHGDFAVIPNNLIDLTDVATQLKAAGIPAELLTLGKLGTNKQFYIPWMQATYIMVANKKALPYLPQGADIKNLTYRQFFQWAKNMNDRLGRPSVGFPAGTTGLMPRFLQGYLVPAFTGRLNTKFKSTEAIQGWEYLRSLWKYVHPQSVTFNFMQDPLLAGEVLVAWDHVARLNTALKTKPDDFVVFPAPSGPKGRAYLPVLAGLAIPKTAPNPAGAKALIRWLNSLSVQARTLSTEGFFPVVAGRLSQKLGPGLLKMAGAVKLQQRSAGALPSLLPLGLGAEGANYNRVFTDTLTRAVIRGENVKSVIADQGNKLQAVLDTAKAPCWKPDPVGAGTCRVG